MAEQYLQELGFNGLEAEIYVCLVESPEPLTGYRLARQLGKPTANVYKAVESLASKGAVLVDDGKRRLCRAVPPVELFARLSRVFEQTCETARVALEQRWTRSGDDRVYQIDSAAAVIERAGQMLRRAETVVVADLFPEAFERLRGDLVLAASRGLQVSCLTYSETECEEIDIVTDLVAGSTRARWPGEWMNLVVDGRELLIAFLSPDLTEVRQAVWTRSPYLAWVSHSGMASEQVLAAVGQRIEQGGDDHLRSELEQLWSLKALDSPGYRDLLRSIGALEPQAEE